MFHLHNQRCLVLILIADDKAPPIEDRIFDCILYENDKFVNCVNY